MKIFDCFIFYNESLLTEIRFNILYNHVDYFLVCESNYDHRGKEKGYNFNINEFKKFKDKIIYIQLDNFPPNLGIWERQDFQRNLIKKSLIDNKVKENDLVIYSDADEIINPKVFSKIDQLNDHVGICEQYCFYYKLNLLSRDYKNSWQGSRIVYFKNLRSISWLRSITKKNLKYSFFRIDKFKKIKIFKESGWHFSYLMNEYEIQKKIKSWTHSEYDKDEITNLTNIRKRISRNEDLFGRKVFYDKVSFSDKYLPKYLIENKKFYKDWII